MAGGPLGCVFGMLCALYYVLSGSGGSGADDMRAHRMWQLVPFTIAVSIAAGFYGGGCLGYISVWVQHIWGLHIHPHVSNLPALRRAEYWFAQLKQTLRNEAETFRSVDPALKDLEDERMKLNVIPRVNLKLACHLPTYTNGTAGTYRIIGPSSNVARLKSILPDVKLEGTMSPRTPVTLPAKVRKVVGISLQATHFGELTGSAHAARVYDRTQGCSRARSACV